MYMRWGWGLGAEAARGRPRRDEAVRGVTSGEWGGAAPSPRGRFVPLKGGMRPSRMSAMGSVMPSCATTRQIEVAKLSNGDGVSGGSGVSTEKRARAHL